MTKCDFCIKSYPHNGHIVCGAYESREAECAKVIEKMIDELKSTRSDKYE